MKRRVQKERRKGCWEDPGKSLQKRRWFGKEKRKVEEEVRKGTMKRKQRI